MAVFFVVFSTTVFTFSVSSASAGLGLVRNLRVFSTSSGKCLTCLTNWAICSGVIMSASWLLIDALALVALGFLVFTEEAVGFGLNTNGAESFVCRLFLVVSAWELSFASSAEAAAAVRRTVASVKSAASSFRFLANRRVSPSRNAADAERGGPNWPRKSGSFKLCIGRCGKRPRLQVELNEKKKERFKQFILNLFSVYKKRDIHFEFGKKTKALQVCTSSETRRTKPKHCAECIFQPDIQVKNVWFYSCF